MAVDVYKDWLGIPDGPKPPDHYALLRLVQFEDDVEKISKNYTRLNAHVRKYAGGQYSNESQNLLNELARAMLCLKDLGRKKEYDASLGREFDESGGAVVATLADWIVDEGHATSDQRDEAESFADARGLSLRDAVVQMKLTDIETATQGYALELGRPYVNLAEMIPDDSVLDLIPRNVVKRHQCLPLFADDDVLLVACAYEPSPDLEEDMQLRYGMPMRAVIATPLSVNQAIAQYFAPGMRDEAAGDQAAPASKQKNSSKKAAPKKKQAASQMTADELQQRKLLGVILICWSVIGSAALDYFVVTKVLGWNSSYLALLTVAPVLSFFIWASHIKK
ncbi:MAG: general secretion pathway protein GspE [Planctomycetaceae bacterium]|nr:general secretion pathway protein GspE [Planctomycetaceae bacterium]MBT6157788.1 general secretion pathway protein GspE [Planctomycetaceae bacterium]MBT6484530.1 general secretion pathway protein GspE [Planctomycetaceae bacterium]MBT6492983.1 general secretion pathway protein GspE [Planctomycetaceae bacterium]